MCLGEVLTLVVTVILCVNSQVIVGWSWCELLEPTCMADNVHSVEQTDPDVCLSLGYRLGNIDAKQPRQHTLGDNIGATHTHQVQSPQHRGPKPQGTGPYWCTIFIAKQG